MFYPKFVLIGRLLVGLFVFINAQVFSATNCPLGLVGPIKTDKGPVCGIEEQTTTGKMAESFRGIPFAETTAGVNRWAPPIPKKSWQIPLQATQFGHFCPQYPLGSKTPKGNEDCLSINVWTPKNRASNAKLPVMVFIYGGGFFRGSSSFEPYKGAYLYNGSYLSANENVVVVTFNYRVGVLGFLAFKEYNGDELEGNYGFLDQQLALQWVQNNIQNFGGDPSNVTLFGESAGAMSVGLHLVSAPSSQALFQQGIMESNPYALPYKTKAEALEIGDIFASLLGCDNIGCLRNRPMLELVRKQHHEMLQPHHLWQKMKMKNILVWTPVIDGKVLTKQPIFANIKKPIIIGNNTDEATWWVALMFPPIPNGAMSPITYTKELLKLFSDEDVGKILKQERYSPDYTSEEKTAAAYAQVLGDYLYLCGSRYVATQLTAATTSYFYLFTYISPFSIWKDRGAVVCEHKACHADELFYVFHSLDKTDENIQFKPKGELLSQQMVAYWANFARERNPNGKGLITWPTFQAPQNTYLILDTSIKPEKEPFASLCKFWDSIGYPPKNLK